MCVHTRGRLFIWLSHVFGHVTVAMSGHGILLALHDIVRHTQNLCYVYHCTSLFMCVCMSSWTDSTTRSVCTVTDFSAWCICMYGVYVKYMECGHRRHIYTIKSGGVCGSRLCLCISVLTLSLCLECTYRSTLLLSIR